MEISPEDRAIKDSYDQLKYHIIEHVKRRQIRADVITDLKNSFELEINSRRRLSCIDSIEDLISVLEKRDVLNALKVDILEKVIRTVGADKAKYLLHHHLISAGNTSVSVNNISVEEDDNQCHQAQGRNFHPERHVDESMGYTQVNNCCTPPIVDDRRQQCNCYQYSGNNSRSRLQPKVTDLICDDIGYKWKDLARGLEIKEGIILEIDATYRTSSAKCRVMLEEYEKTVKQCEIQRKLLKGLSKARRKDLAEKVLSLMV